MRCASNGRWKGSLYIGKHFTFLCSRDIHDEYYARYNMKYDTLRVEIRGGSGEWDWPILNPGLLLQTLVSEQPQLFELYMSRMIMCPCTPQRPWRVLVGFDEFSPGDKLKCDLIFGNDYTRALRPRDPRPRFGI